MSEPTQHADAAALAERRFNPLTDGPRLRQLAAQNLYLGTSSWKYEGWAGQVYIGDYSGAKKSFVKSRFESDSLKEYGIHFPTVCFDGAYWRFPEEKQLKRYASELPDDFRMALKVTDLITMRRFNRSIMNRKKGEDNSTYLDYEAFESFFLRPAIDGLGTRLGPIIFEFSPFHFDKSFGQRDYTPLQFVKDLHNFLSKVPKNLTIGIEVRDPLFLDPEFGRYLDCLRYHGVSHVVNEQTWMPTIEEQLSRTDTLTADYTVVRALVRPGVAHDEAVEEFSPYDRTQLVLPGLRRSLADLMKFSVAERRGLYIYVNNRTEGNSPNTIAGILDMFEQPVG